MTDEPAVTLPMPQERDHPIDIVEAIAQEEEWGYERSGDGNEVTILVEGRCTDYQVSFTWMEDVEALHIGCAFDLKVGEHTVRDLQELISLINAELWIGHFDLWKLEGLVVFRYALILAEFEVRGGQVIAMLQSALSTCENHYAAFQHIVWAGSTAREALAAALLRTEGNA